jgi:hypothetical protein
MISSSLLAFWNMHVSINISFFKVYNEGGFGFRNPIVCCKCVSVGIGISRRTYRSHIHVHSGLFSMVFSFSLFCLSISFCSSTSFNCSWFSALSWRVLYFATSHVTCLLFWWSHVLLSSWIYWPVYYLLELLCFIERNSFWSNFFSQVSPLSRLYFSLSNSSECDNCYCCWELDVVFLAILCGVARILIQFMVTIGDRVVLIVLFLISHHNFWFKL